MTHASSWVGILQCGKSRIVSVAHFFSLRAEKADTESLWPDNAPGFHWSLPHGTVTWGHAGGHCLSSVNKTVHGLDSRSRPCTAWGYSFCFTCGWGSISWDPVTCFPVYNTAAKTISSPGAWKSLKVSLMYVLCMCWICWSNFHHACMHDIDYPFLLYATDMMWLAVLSFDKGFLPVALSAFSLGIILSCLLWLVF